MEVFGKERGFMMTVGASAEIAKLCPDHRLEKWTEMLRASDDVTSIENRAALIVALNKGYETNRAYSEEGYRPDPLTVEAVLALPNKTFLQLLNEALAATVPQREIESEPVKKNTGAGGV